MADGVIEGIIAIFVSIVLVWALFPVLSQIGAVYGLVFLLLGCAVIGAAILGLVKG